MSVTVLLIDPQNDFCDLHGAALPVPGSSADMQRAAAFIKTAECRITEVVITLDSHPTVAIERTTFWRKSDGTPVAPFTQITATDVKEGRYVPRNEALLADVLIYLETLEKSQKYRLMVWPVHCVIGTWGHNMYSAIGSAVAAWEELVQRGACKVLKGQNPMTEQYSAIQAEVPLANDPSTSTNARLVERCRPKDGWLLVAGEAASHCVAATMEHLLDLFSEEERRRVVLLRDCMSPVTGFESHAQAFFDRAVNLGVRLETAGSALSLLDRNS